ncbi:hypothetical protein, partial [Escherichia coli]|uniref:hypothetical protein n=1 Tax=Escherichia coli TaxID=562 RepID=UPI001BE41C14
MDNLWKTCGDLRCALTLDACACSLSRAMMRIPTRPLILAFSAALFVLGCIEQPGTGTGTSGGTSASSGGTSGSGSGTDAGSLTAAGKACLD